MDLYYELAELVDDLALENPMSLVAVAAETGLKVQMMEKFTRNGGPPFGFNTAMVDAAFSVGVLDDGENSPLIELATGSAIILRVAGHQPSVVQPLEEVRDRVEASVRAQKAGTIARERGGELLARLKTGGASNVVAAEFGVEVQQTGMLKRGSSELSAELLAEIYRMPHPVDGKEYYRGLVLANGGYAALRLDRLEAGRAETIPQEARDQRKQTLAEQSGSNLLSALVTDLREKANTIIAPGLFDRPETF